MSTPEYTLLYHPTIPGRGEYVRLCFEATKTKYTDAANTSEEGKNEVYGLIDPKSTGKGGNPPFFAPPMLKISSTGGKDLIISQTPNILLYLGKYLDLAGRDPEIDIYQVNSLALTALDVSNEAHDTHHPVASSQYYEDQKDEALKKAKNFREERLPKFFGYFERVMKGNEAMGKGKYLVGDKLTFADLTLWQVLDGLMYAFPNEMKHQAGQYPLLMQTLYPNIKEIEGIKEYLASERRMKYSMGIFRLYPELDRAA